MIQPDPRLRAELKRRCKQAAGFDFADVRWDPEEEALCIFKWNRNRTSETRHGLPLTDEAGNPRQVNQRDVDDLVNAIYGHNEMVDNWKKRYEERKAKYEADRLNARSELAAYTAREIVRVVRHGLREYAFQGDAGKPLEPAGRKTKYGYRINDRRRVK